MSILGREVYKYLVTMQIFTHNAHQRWNQNKWDNNSHCFSHKVKKIKIKIKNKKKMKKKKKNKTVA